MEEIREGLRKACWAAVPESVLFLEFWFLRQHPSQRDFPTLHPVMALETNPKTEAGKTHGLEVDTIPFLLKASAVLGRKMSNHRLTAREAAGGCGEPWTGLS